MASWTFHAGNVFSRSLGRNELAFFYDAQHSTGTADLHVHASIRLTRDIEYYDFDRAWLSVKALYPLLGATVHVDDDGSVPQFIVSEERLKSLQPGEISRSSVSSADEARRVAAALPNGPRILCKNQLARLSILTQADDASMVHAIIHIQHLITDGVGNSSLLKEFLGFLSEPSEMRTTHDLPARLALAVSAESLVPATKTMSVARQRWRRAAGYVISKLQDAKRTGGQTLPRNFGPIALKIPARSAFYRSEFPPLASSLFIRTCRTHALTFGSALPVLAQLALARLLSRHHRHHLLSRHSSAITQSEWEFRKHQPYHTAGPQNLRPFLDRAWFERGGARGVSVNVGYFFFTLPFTPLPLVRGSGGGGGEGGGGGGKVPEFAELMTPGRFLLRCNMMKRQAALYLKHPLFFEVAGARMEGRVERARELAAQWEANPLAYTNVPPGEVAKHDLSPMEQVEAGAVNTHAWSTFGTDSDLPRRYPTHTAPTLILQKYESFLHCRTGELYLASGTTDGQLYLLVMYDRNVYAPEVVEEWVGEIRGAMHFYLGDNDNLAVSAKL